MAALVAPSIFTVIRLSSVNAPCSLRPIYRPKQSCSQLQALCLSDLTCTEQDVMTKAEAQRYAGVVWQLTTQEKQS